MKLVYQYFLSTLVFVVGLIVSAIGCIHCAIFDRPGPK